MVYSDQKEVCVFVYLMAPVGFLAMAVQQVVHGLQASGVHLVSGLGAGEEHQDDLARRVGPAFHN